MEDGNGGGVDRRSFLATSLATVGAAALPEVRQEPRYVLVPPTYRGAAARMLETEFPGSSFRVEWIPLVVGWNESEEMEYRFVAQDPITVTVES